MSLHTNFCSCHPDYTERVRTLRCIQRLPGPFCLLITTVVIACCTSHAAAFEPNSDTVRIEEDWVAYVRHPDSNICAPQIVNYLAISDAVDVPFALFELNHGSAPDFESGGLQVQTWAGDARYNYEKSTEGRRLYRDYDMVQYTVGVEIDGDDFRFKVSNGHSRSWGPFVETGLSATVPRLGGDLSDYRPQISVDNTTVNVGAHRLDMLVQYETRYYSEDGLQHTDEDDRIIHRFHELVQFVSLDEYEANQDEYNIDITE